MPSIKCRKYMSQYADRNYSIKAKKLEKSDLKRHAKKEEVTLQSLLHDSEHDLSSYGRQVLLSDEVVANEPFSDNDSLALQIYKSALKGVKKLKKKKAKET